jgi:hypothetical protein
MSVTLPVYLQDRRTSQLVEARLIDGLTREEVEKAEADWKPFLDEQVKRMEQTGIPRNKWPQHRHWNWREKYEASEEYLAYRMFGIECQSQMQGLMLALTAGKNSLIASQRKTARVCSLPRCGSLESSQHRCGTPLLPCWEHTPGNSNPLEHGGRVSGPYRASFIASVG